MVDVWHCDAEGIYSGVTDTAVGFDTTGTQFLRGYQVTGEDGVAAFTTIYPGWYTGRTVHIHFKIRTTGSDGQAYEFTSQLYFDDALSDQVFAQEPYSAKGQRDQLNATDGIFQEETLLSPVGAEAGGYNATFAIALDLSDADTGAADGGGGPGGGPPPGGG